MIGALVVLSLGLLAIGISLPAMPPIPRPRWSDLAPVVFLLGLILVLIGAVAFVEKLA